MTSQSKSVRQYGVITTSYWLFTMTDGALRMLVVLHFHNLGFNALQIAFLFLFYEVFGVVTNMAGGHFGARFGLNRIMNIGLVLQLIALSLLLVPTPWLSIPWVMAAQALSGVAKDLNKMSAKSSIKFLLPDEAQGQLYKWVSLLTGSKNTLKGFGFFIGALLLSLWGFRTAIGVLLALIVVALIMNLVFLRNDFGKSAGQAKFTNFFSRGSAINRLSVARLFLFAARDVWFVVGLPVYFSSKLGFSHWQVGAFMALWIIVYGIIQAFAPRITLSINGQPPGGRSALFWAMVLFGLTVLLTYSVYQQWPAHITLIPGLFVFGAVFAVNSSIHSYLIVSYAGREATSVDVGFYYMANAAGRLLGTVLSGLLFVTAGLGACLVGSCVLLIIATAFSSRLPGSRAAPELR